MVQEDVSVPAECVDHIDGHDRPSTARRPSARQTQSLCLNCNRAKAIQLERGFNVTATGVSSLSTDHPSNHFEEILEPHVSMGKQWPAAFTAGRGAEAGHVGART